MFVKVQNPELVTSPAAVPIDPGVIVQELVLI
jgi:hypothetical protein